jgi:hypothetical protein
MKSEKPILPRRGFRDLTDGEGVFFLAIAKFQRDLKKYTNLEYKFDNK